MSNIAVPKEAVFIYNKALDYSTKGDLNTAINEYKRALELCPTFVEAYNNIGEIYSRIGKNELAMSTYQKALRIDRNPRLLLNMGVEYYNHREFRTALGFFKESLVRKPDFLEGNFYTGLASFNLKDEQMAENYFKKVVEADRRHLKSNYLLSYIYYDWKDYAKTLFHLNNIKDIADDKVFLNKYFGFCYYHLGQYNEAVKYLNSAIQQNPKYSQFKNYLENLTYENKIKEAGNIDAKIKEMEKMMIDRNLSIREITQLSLLYTYKGDYKKAEQILVDKKNQFK
ncbi:MAG: tetratricopeptide repeat protein [Spirochaetes bacterium]|nr:tetratricopeptide repeat protein [Spirochaetota bacterium]